MRLTVSGRTVLAQAADICRSGMLLGCVFDALYPSQQRCDVQFSLPGQSRPLFARAEMVRQRKHQRFHLVALRFRAIPPSHRREIVAYLESAKLEATPPPAFLPL